MSVYDHVLHASRLSLTLAIAVGRHDFSWGVANRGASIRVGRSVPVEKSGYYEVRPSVLTPP